MTAPKPPGPDSPFFGVLDWFHEPEQKELQEQMTIEPLKPEDLEDHEEFLLPDDVIGIWNHLIKGQWDGKRASVEQSSALIEMEIYFSSRYPRDAIDEFVSPERVIPIYKSAGWTVRFREMSRESFFIFTKY